MAIAPLSYPGYAAPRDLDFSPLAKLAEQWKANQQQQVQQEALAAYAGGDPSALLRSGNMSLAQLYVQDQAKKQAQANADRTFQAGRDDAARAQRNADRSYGLQAAAARRAEADAGKPIFKEITDANGNTSIYRITRDGQASRVDTGVIPEASGNPFGAGKFNEGQGKAAGFTDRMLQSEGILSGVNPDSGIGPPSPGVDVKGTSLAARGLAKVPIYGNYMLSSDYQKYDQAKRDFINAQLRRESGAAIAESEFENADRQYFPVPGDTPDVIEQKRANRRAAVEAMGRESGPSYRPKSSFGAGGRLQSRGGSETGARARPITQEQFNALPSGSVFTAPDGTQRVKP